MKLCTCRQTNQVNNNEKEILMRVYIATPCDSSWHSSTLGFETQLSLYIDLFKLCYDPIQQHW